jgi:hypothetical protein
MVFTVSKVEMMFKYSIKYRVNYQGRDGKSEHPIEMGKKADREKGWPR